MATKRMQDRDEERVMGTLEEENRKKRKQRLKGKRHR